MPKDRSGTRRHAQQHFVYTIKTMCMGRVGSTCGRCRFCRLRLFAAARRDAGARLFEQTPRPFRSNTSYRVRAHTKSSPGLGGASRAKGLEEKNALSDVLIVANRRSAAAGPRSCATRRLAETDLDASRHRTYPFNVRVI